MKIMGIPQCSCGPGPTDVSKAVTTLSRFLFHIHLPIAVHLVALGEILRTHQVVNYRA